MDNIKKNPVGPPTKYKEEYLKMLKEHMARGFSYSSFGAIVEVGANTLYLWEEAQPEWKEAKRIAVEKAKYFFETRLLAKVSGQKQDADSKFDVRLIDTASVIFALKTRFHKEYGDHTKHEHDISDDVKKLVVNLG